MSGRKARRAFKKMGANFVTPDILRYHDAGDWGMELSTGNILGNQVWGVSVINLETEKIVSDASKMFYSLEEAEAYISKIKKGRRKNK